MKTAGAGLAAHIALPTTSICTCWHITRRDGVEFFFTDHDHNIVFGGDTYLAAVGYTRTAISASSGLDVDNVEMTGIFDDDSVTLDDLRSKKFNYAEVETFLLNWADLTQGQMKLRKGHIGEVSASPSGMFNTEFRGMGQAFSQKLVEVYAPECRADLGDARCQVNLASFTSAETVTAVTDTANFTLSNGDVRAVDGWYDGGLLTWVTGDNADSSMEVKTWLATGVANLFMPMPLAIQVGDTCNVVAGCNKLLGHCRDKFNNVVNRRAEDYIPGVDSLMQVGGR